MTDYELAIPYTYNNQTYRSQAEALWARLMSQVKIRYSYEPVTVEFPDGRKYNPDFFLSAVGRYVEIKNYLGNIDTATITRDCQFVNDLARCTSKHALLIDGPPARAVAYVFDGRPPEDGWKEGQNPIESFAYRRIGGGSNAVPILSEFIQPSGYEATVPTPWYFIYGSRIRIENLAISFEGEIHRGADPTAQFAQNTLLRSRVPIPLTEPTSLPTNAYIAHQRDTTVY
ncbi:hypothetical protein H0V99_02425 [Candidatus Saccharibacteria bacterium]|nr:hypothetical protein [Candidatus Saccharibacteria bacterium]